MKGLFEEEEIRQQVGKEGSGMKVREVGRCPNPLDRREIGRRVCGFAGVCTLPPSHGGEHYAEDGEDHKERIPDRGARAA